jgi:hypothetical protein
MRLSSRRFAILVVAVLAACVLLWLARPIERERVALLPGGSSAFEDATTEVGSEVEEPLESRREAVALPTATEEARAVPTTKVGVGHVRVLVRAKEDGAPQARTEVVVTSNSRPSVGEGSRGANGRSKRTNDQGRAEFEVVPGEALDVQVIDERAQILGRKLDAPADGKSVELVFELLTREDVRLYGQLVEEESGAPLAGRVLVMSVGPGRIVETDSAGRFELTARSWEKARATAEAECRAPARFTIATGYEDPLRPLFVRLSRAAVLEAFVRDRTGALIDGADVHVATVSQPQPRPTARMITLPTDAASSHWIAETDSNGCAILDELLPGIPLRISVSADGWPSRSEPEPFVLQAGEQRRVDLVLGRGATLSGVLEETSGRPIPRCEVWCEPALDRRPRVFDEGMRPSSRTWTDAEGSFRFEMLPTGLYWIGPASHSRSNKLADDYLPLAQVVEVIDEGAELEIVVRVDRGVTIEGHVLDRDGLAAGKCAVHRGTNRGLGFRDRGDRRAGRVHDRADARRCLAITGHHHHGDEREEDRNHQGNRRREG